MCGAPRSRAAIQTHQVVVVCGETGSGKTTQLPKICLELGRGLQRPDRPHPAAPHRRARHGDAHRAGTEVANSAATSATRSASPTSVSPDTYIKLMTDGILLAETQSDPLLRQYDTILIDEAHERSLNIDFLLGYLKQLLPKRPDLKVIVTSATLDAERFSQALRRRAGDRGLRPPVSRSRCAIGPSTRRKDARPERRHRRCGERGASRRAGRRAGLPARRARDPRGGRGAAQAPSTRAGDPAAVRPPVGAGAERASSRRIRAGAWCWRPTSPRPR